VDLLRQCADDLDGRHSPQYTKAVKQAIDLLTPFVEGDDDDTSSQESRRRGRYPAPRTGKELLEIIEKRVRDSQRGLRRR
jgi:hypothetical protein